jgi:hypothetical protein
MTAAATTSTPAGGGNWTVVRRRRGDAPRTASQPDAAPPLPVTPIPWSPSDPSLDPAGVSRLVARADAVISRVAATRLYRRLLLPDSPLRRRLSLLGVGRFESSPAALLQLALAALLRRDLLPDSATADLLDPVLGFSVPSLNDGGRRRVEEPTLFYIPTARRRSTTRSSPPTGSSPRSSDASACSATASGGTRSRPRRTVPAPPPRPRMSSRPSDSRGRSGLMRQMSWMEVTGSPAHSTRRAGISSRWRTMWTWPPP